MANAPTYEVEVEDVEYQRLNGEPMLARVYRPKGTGPFPALVDVHGGAWNNGDRMNNVGTDQALAARGVVVAAIDFRQPPEASYPASICDLNLGIRWLKLKAPDFGGTSAVGAFGNSSGGHQVVLSGMRPRHAAYSTLPLPGHNDIDAELAYVIAAWPVICPLYRYQYAQSKGRQQLVDSHLRFWGSEAGMAEGSPQTIAEEEENITLPPILMMLKKDDDNHPIEMQERFIASYEKRGGPIEMRMFDGLPERRMSPGPGEPESVRAIDTMLDFIRRYTPGAS